MKRILFLTLAMLVALAFWLGAPLAADDEITLTGLQVPAEVRVKETFVIIIFYKSEFDPGRVKEMIKGIYIITSGAGMNFPFRFDRELLNKLEFDVGKDTISFQVRMGKVRRGATQTVFLEYGDKSTNRVSAPMDILD